MALQFHIINYSLLYDTYALLQGELFVSQPQVCNPYKGSVMIFKLIITFYGVELVMNIIIINNSVLHPLIIDRGLSSLIVDHLHNN